MLEFGSAEGPAVNFQPGDIVEFVESDVLWKFSQEEKQVWGPNIPADQQFAPGTVEEGTLCTVLKIATYPTLDGSELEVEMLLLRPDGVLGWYWQGLQSRPPREIRLFHRAEVSNV